MRPMLRSAQWLALTALAICAVSAPDTAAASQQQRQQSRQCSQACCAKKPLLFQTGTRTDATMDRCFEAGQHRYYDHLQTHNRRSSPTLHQHCSKQLNKMDRPRQQKHIQKQKHPPTFPSSKHPGKQPVCPTSIEGSDGHYKHRIRSTQHTGSNKQGSATKRHPSSDKKTRRRSFRKGTFHKNGRIYVLAHQDWYTQYRRQRGPKGVMRKLTLENARRRKAMVTLLPSSYTGSNNKWSSGSGVGNGSGNGNGKNNNTDHNLNNGSVGDNLSAGGAEDEARGKGDESGDDIDPQSDEDDSPDRATGTIQAVKRPTFMGIPEPISYRHRGLIPKSRSGGQQLDPRQRVHYLEICFFVLWAFTA